MARLVGSQVRQASQAPLESAVLAAAVASQAVQEPPVAQETSETLAPPVPSAVVVQPRSVAQVASAAQPVQPV
jgi:hypothetical protein